MTTKRAIIPCPECSQSLYAFECDEPKHEGARVIELTEERKTLMNFDGTLDDHQRRFVSEWEDV